MSGRPRTLSGAPLLLMGLLVAPPTEASSQVTAQVLREENFRRDPNGVVLGRVLPGASLSVVQEAESWLQVDLDGWVWLNSLQASDSDFDLVVAAADGENLRDGPAGSVVGRLAEGALLDELGREPGWVRVGRRGWIWSASVDRAQAAASAAAAPASSPSGPIARRPEGFTSVATAGAPILTSPDGDTLALASARSDLQIVARDGNWARVRIEGWMWMPATQPAAETADATPSALEPGDLTASPGAHVGRVVAWGLQFISVERAEEIRTDFREGEPFLLTRFGGPDGPFVYVAVPPERMSDIEGLIPLERITVTARIRTGASSLTGTPIVDLLSLEKIR